MKRSLSYLLPVLCILLLVEVVGGVLRAPYLTWNDIRLARAGEVLRGLPLYPGRDALGPIIGTLHTPLSHLYFIPAAMLPDVTAGIVAGSLLAVLAVLIPVAWVAFRAVPGSSYGLPCFLLAAFLIIQSPGTYHVLFLIHADAPAVGLATLGCGLLTGAGEWKRSHYWFAGLACAMSVATKQTMAPVIVAVAAYLFLAGGIRPALHFLGAAAVGGALLLAAILIAWSAPDVLFNIWTLASSRPRKPAALQILVTAYRDMRLDSLPALLPVLYIAVSNWRTNARQFAQQNRWLVFALCSIFMLPVSLKAMITIGSSVNHLGVVLYFLYIAAALAILQSQARLFLAVGILVGISPGLALEIVPGFTRLRSNPSQLAVDYNHRHPGHAYFPWNPEAGLYHVDGALFDREAVGYALTGAQLQSGLPKQFTIVAIPPGEQLTSRALLDMTAKYRPIVDPELPGWTVLQCSKAR